MKRLLKHPLIWLGLIVAAGMVAYPFYQRIFAPNVTTPNEAPAEFYIYRGSDYRMVGEALRDQQLIQDLKGFHWVANQMNYPNHVYPGRYEIPHGLSNLELIRLLRSGVQSPLNFTFVKFRTVDQLGDYVASKLEMSKSEFMEVMNDEEFLKEHNGLTPQTAMTVFLPNTYELYWNIKPRAFFERMFKEYKAYWNDTRNERRKQLGLTRLDVMTLASIVEEETNKKDEMPTVAGVYLNRLRKRWPLEADPTVKYAVGDFSIKRVLDRHLETDSPYNTYMYPGLPPGPICTPSLPAIDAVLQNEQHKYMFFCARIDGSGYHHFSKTLSEHNRYAREYHRMLNRRGIR
ncbi:endolytic transglycosylase MltG [Pontibacter sp. G13]|uniref:endolytic transglycosylase MltG n=1 Tax=Pontibacter sp. G13 TaxID=3074898 RepID=UPI002889D33C|nr:endolytic transglycosylase MltG [Pontibacter sp. G13]WNJ16264.1 endolytic transglycosylase MltG [Pontibacter sp. G13]